MIRFLGNQNEHSRKSLMSYLLYNLSRSERTHFHITHDKGKRAYFISSQNSASRVLRVDHTIAFANLLETVNATQTIQIGFAEFVTYIGSTTHNNVAVDYGGGVTIPASISLTHDVEAYVSRVGNPAGVISTGGTNVSDPISIIIAHELLGHARLMITGLPSGQPEAIQSENDFRRGRGLEERQP